MNVLPAEPMAAPARGPVLVRPAAAASAGRPVEVGIRPEHLALVPDGRARPRSRSSRSPATRRSSTWTPAASGSSRASGREQRPAGRSTRSRVAVTIPSSVHVFDAETGRRALCMTRPRARALALHARRPTSLGLVVLVVASRRSITFGARALRVRPDPLARLHRARQLPRAAGDEIFRIVAPQLARSSSSSPCRCGSLGALGLALLLHRRFRGVGAYRTGVYLPTIVPDVAYALLWLWIFNPLYGPINLALDALGVPRAPRGSPTRATRSAAIVIDEPSSRSGKGSSSPWPSGSASPASCTSSRRVEARGAVVHLPPPDAAADGADAAPARSSATRSSASR